MNGNKLIIGKGEEIRATFGGAFQSNGKKLQGEPQKRKFRVKPTEPTATAQTLLMKKYIEVGKRNISFLPSTAMKTYNY